MRRDGISEGLKKRIVEERIEKIKKIMEGMMDEERILKMNVNGEIEKDLMSKNVGKKDDGIERSEKIVDKGRKKEEIED